MELLFMSNLFPKEIKVETQKKMRFNMYDAADVLQWNLIDGLEANGQSLSLLNLLPVDSWPQHYADAVVKRQVFSHKEGARDINVGFCNVKYLKRILMRRAYIAEAKKWAKRTNGSEDRVVIAYSLNNSFISAIKAMKRKAHGLKAIAIVADLPEFSAPAHTFLRRIYRDHINKSVQRNLSVFDGFVLLTDQMAARMNIRVPYMVMEGIAGCAGHTDQPAAGRTIFYSGSMNVKYGITVLLKAFSAITDENVQLVLCGLGDAQEVVQQYASKDPRIRYLGKVPHEEVRLLQQQATVLVNPRQNNEEFTKYSFPSKTMEYLASGVPVVCYKLDGIPDEYDAYLNYVKDDSPEALAEKLMQICDMDEEKRKKLGQNGADFVLKNKNAVVQARRILEFIQ